MLLMKMWVSQSYILNTWVNYKQLYSVQIERCDLWGSQTVRRREWQVPAAFFIFSAKSSCQKEEEWKHCILVIYKNCHSLYVVFLIFSSILSNLKSTFCCFSLHVTATSEYNVHVCIYTVMYFTYGYNNDVNNYFFFLGLLYCEASAKTWVLSWT